jgi:hypothetical protein
LPGRSCFVIAIYHYYLSADYQQKARSGFRPGVLLACERHIVFAERRNLFGAKLVVNRLRNVLSLKRLRAAEMVAKDLVKP